MCFAESAKASADADVLIKSLTGDLEEATAKAEKAEQQCMILDKEINELTQRVQ